MNLETFYYCRCFWPLPCSVVWVITFFHHFFTLSFTDTCIISLYFSNIMYQKTSYQLAIAPVSLIPRVALLPLMVLEYGAPPSKETLSVYSLGQHAPCCMCAHHDSMWTAIPSHKCPTTIWYHWYLGCMLPIYTARLYTHLTVDNTYNSDM